MSYLGTKPANSPLTSELIPDGMIGTSDLANGAVSPTKLSTGAPTWDTSGNVGIGTSSPAQKLTVNGNVIVGVGQSYNTYTTDYGVGTPSSSGMQVFTGTGDFIGFSHKSGATLTERMRINSAGNLLVGTTTSLTTAKVTLNSPAAGSWAVGPALDYNVFFVLNSSAIGAYIANGGTSWTANSDERLKTALVPFENAIEKVSSLRAGTGRYLTDDESVSRSFLIAQDVQKVLPEAVDATNPDKLGVQYTEVIPLLVAAIKEQQTIINDLKARIEALEQA